MEASRIANVSAAVLLGGAQAARSSRPAGAGDSADLPARLFEQALRIGEIGGEARLLGPGIEPEHPVDFVDGLAAAILAARGERVIVVGEGDPRASAEVLLALVAWPEKPVVLVEPESLGQPGAPSHPLGIFRRDALEERAHARARAGAWSLAALLAGLEVERVSLAQLGLAPHPIPPFAGPFPGPGHAG